MRLKDLLRETFQNIEELYEGLSFRRGALSTGCPGLDAASGGLVRGELTLVAGRPASGKTSLAVSAARSAALEGRAVLFASLQWPRTDFAFRMMALEAEVELEGLLGDRLEDDDWPKLTRAAGVLADAPLHVEDANPARFQDVKRWAEARIAKGALDLVVVDHLGRLGDGSPAALRGDAQRLRALARAFGVPVLVTVELGPSVDARPDGRPLLGDLEDVGLSASDADGVWLVSRPAPRGGSQGAVCVAARRAGGYTRHVELLRCGPGLRFVGAAEVAADSGPLSH